MATESEMFQENYKFLEYRIFDFSKLSNSRRYNPRFGYNHLLKLMDVLTFHSIQS